MNIHAVKNIIKAWSGLDTTRRIIVVILIAVGIPLFIKGLQAECAYQRAKDAFSEPCMTTSR